MLMLKLNKRMWKLNTILALSIMTLSAPAIGAEPVKGKDCLDLEKMLAEVQRAPKVNYSTVDIRGLEEAGLHPRLKAHAITRAVMAPNNLPGADGSVTWTQSGCRSVFLTEKFPDASKQTVTVEMRILGFSQNSLQLESMDEDRHTIKIRQTGPGSANMSYIKPYDRSLPVCGQEISGKAQLEVFEQIS